jgi:hypothetical protein
MCVYNASCACKAVRDVQRSADHAIKENVLKICAYTVRCVHAKLRVMCKAVQIMAKKKGKEVLCKQ